MGKHHLVLGELIDTITGDILEDTHDERYRQEIARLLLEEKGYQKDDILPRKPLLVEAGAKKAVIPMDFVIRMEDRICMLIKYGPGSLVTRRKPALSASRLLGGHEIPVVVVTNGVSAEIIDGSTGKVLNDGLDRIPSKVQLQALCRQSSFSPVSAKRLEMEARIVYAYEIDDSCPCDDSVCRL
jgi:hypothetical protein